MGKAMAKTILLVLGIQGIFLSAPQFDEPLSSTVRVVCGLMAGLFIGAFVWLNDLNK